MNSRRFIQFSFAASLVFNLSCSDLKIDRSSAGGNARTMTPDNATIETSTVETSGGGFALKATGTAEYGCEFTATDSGTQASTRTSAEALASTTSHHANRFTTPSYMNIVGAVVRVRKIGGPTGNMGVDLSTSSAGDPGTLMQSSGAVLMSSIPSTVADGNLMNFSLSGYEAAAGENLVFTLRPLSGASLDGTNHIRWVTSNNTAPDGCTDFPVYRFSSDGGSTWGDSSNGGYRRSFFTVVAQTFESSGQVSWILQGNSGGGWDMSTFSFDENPSGITEGVITYDVGAGSSANTPTYTSTGLTHAQVVALGNFDGEYLYVRANLATSSTFDQAELGEGSVSAN